MDPSTPHDQMTPDEFETVRRLHEELDQAQSLAKMKSIVRDHQIRKVLGEIANPTYDADPFDPHRPCGHPRCESCRRPITFGWDDLTGGTA